MKLKEYKVISRKKLLRYLVISSGITFAYGWNNVNAIQRRVDIIDESNSHGREQASIHTNIYDALTINKAYKNDLSTYNHGILIERLRTDKHELHIYHSDSIDGSYEFGMSFNDIDELQSFINSISE